MPEERFVLQCSLAVYDFPVLYLLLPCAKVFGFSLTPISHHRHGQDKTVWSCLVRVGGVN